MGVFWMRKTRLILGAFVAATALACTGCGEDADSNANVDLETMTSEAETTPEEEPEVIVKTSIVTEIVVKPATETETVANATPAATAAPAASAANPTTGDIYTDVIAQYRIASDKEVCPYVYVMADLDLDGYPELMVTTGNCEANYAYEIWTKGANGKAVKAGTANGFHAHLYYNDQNGTLYSNYYHQGVQEIMS